MRFETTTMLANLYRIMRFETTTMLANLYRIMRFETMTMLTNLYRIMRFETMTMLTNLAMKLTLWEYYWLILVRQRGLITNSLNLMEELRIKLSV